MKATGYVRQVDELGRVVLPKDLRQERGIGPKDAVEIFVDGESIVMQKYAPGCVFCGETKDLSEFKQKRICKTCAGELGGPAAADG